MVVGATCWHGLAMVGVTAVTGLILSAAPTVLADSSAAPATFDQLIAQAPLVILATIPGDESVGYPCHVDLALTWPPGDEFVFPPDRSQPSNPGGPVL
jgi:hypothetical protein